MSHIRGRLIAAGIGALIAVHGLDLAQASPAAMVRSTAVPILLIHGTADRNIPRRHSRELYALNPATELWEVPAAPHVALLSTAPEQYERRVVEWFRTHT